MSYLRRRDEQRQEEDQTRETIRAQWKHRLETELEWDYVRERLTAAGPCSEYDIGTLNELLVEVIQPAEEDKGFFKNEPGGSIAVTRVLIQKVIQEQGLGYKVSDRSHILVTLPVAETLTQEENAPNV